MKDVLVTGATGYLGQALCRALLREGAKVTAVSRGLGRPAPDGARAVVADVTDPVALAGLAASYDTIFHLAAMVSFDPAMAGRLLDVNARGTAGLLTAARSWGAGRVVVVSSACTIGLSARPDAVLDETAAPDPALCARNPYLASKLGAEAAALTAARLGQDVVVVNPTTVYGPGDYSLNSGTLILSVAKSALVPVPPGGSNVVDVDDVVDGMLAAARRGRVGERYILGGANLRFAEIVDVVAQVVGRRPLRLPVPALARMPMALAAGLVQKFTGSRLLTPQIVEDLFSFKFYSSAKAASELGFTAARPFADTVARAWEFYRREGLA